MNSDPKYCSNCGEKLDYNIEMKKCPKCGTDLDLRQNKQSSTVVESLPYKSPGTATLIAFIGGIFSLPGIGHIYVGKLGKGIAILVGGFILYILMILSIIYITTPLTHIPQYAAIVGVSNFIMIAIITTIALSVGYIAFFIWQIFDARKLAKKFNETVRTAHKEPW
jgi:predicted RNA-binding Zn-ribbon protein involved in translation (DUF1610 family)